MDRSRLIIKENKEDRLLFDSKLSSKIIEIKDWMIKHIDEMNKEFNL